VPVVRSQLTGNVRSLRAGGLPDVERMAEHARLPPCLAEPRGHRLRWLLQLSLNVLLIPGTASLAHLRDNLAAENVTLDDEARRDLDGVGA
jgi:aryl-alcohol dehydrogenase-like predicted oxidoreductase